MVVGARICELTEFFLWFVCGLYVGILTSPLKLYPDRYTVKGQGLRRGQAAGAR